MRAEVFSVGTELLLGEIVDTNAAYLAQQLSALGIDLYYISQIGDNLGRLVDAMKRAKSRSDLVVITGGLGPTEDDLTREAIAETLGEQMVVQPDLERELRDFFARRNRVMPETNVKQATLIPSSQAIPNPVGTAPGWWVEKDGWIAVAMPGVPSEMHRMWENEVAPRLRDCCGGSIIYSRTLKVVGLGESTVEEMIRPLLNSSNPTLATYAKNDGIHVRIAAKAASQEEAERIIAGPEAKVREILGESIYGVNEESLESVVGKLLLERGLTLATMESCSGGYLASLITDVPGSSAYFRGGAVAYSNEMKIELGVPRETIEQHGAVSEATAAAMATAIRRRLRADVGLAVTGVAGPSLLEGKPIGTAHIALDLQGKPSSFSQVFGTMRAQIKRISALNALNLLRLELMR